MANLHKLEKKMGNALGLEKATQAAVEHFFNQGLLDKDRTKDKLQTITKQDKNHERDLQELTLQLSESKGLSNGHVEEIAKDTEQKTSEIMKTYLGDNPNSSEVLEFLCLAQAGEITHYELLNAITREIKNEKFATKVKAILAEEKKHLQLYTRLAKQDAISSG
jgi:rubrerythrin